MKKRMMVTVRFALVTAAAWLMVWRYVRYQRIELEIARFDYMMRVMKEEEQRDEE